MKVAHNALAAVICPAAKHLWRYKVGEGKIFILIFIKQDYHTAPAPTSYPYG